MSNRRKYDLTCLIFVLRNEAQDSDVFLWLQDADIEAHDGQGTVTFTADRDRAKRFPSPVEAANFWRRQSTVRPRRPDGTRNRPLTAFTMLTQPASASAPPPWPASAIDFTEDV
jgi:hypothetical protein